MIMIIIINFDFCSTIIKDKEYLDVLHELMIAKNRDIWFKAWQLGYQVLAVRSVLMNHYLLMNIDICKYCHKGLDTWRELEVRVQ